jgi:hypothetical protein
MIFLFLIKMGSCNSAIQKAEIAGSFIGSALIAAAFPESLLAGGIAANAVVGGAGLGIAFTKKNPSCDKSAEALITATNSIVAYAITKTITECNVNANLQQDINIKCVPVVPDGTVYEENAACGQCLKNILLDNESQNELERSMWANSPAEVRQPIDTMYESLLVNMESCGLTYCKACVLLNVTQQNIFEATSVCMSRNMTQTNVKTNISTILQQTFLNNQDVLSGAAQTLGAQGVNTLSTNISNTISSVVTNEFLADLRTSISTSQVIQLTNTTSTTLNKITQSSILNVTSKFVTDRSVATNSYSNEVFDQISLIANQQNTLNEVGEVVFKSTVTFTKAIDSSIGKIMIAVLIILGLVVFSIICYIIYKSFIKTIVAGIEVNKHDELSRHKLSAFEQF